MVTDISGLIVAGLQLGLPGDEDDVFSKTEAADVLSSSMVESLRRMRHFRNILVHDYMDIDDEIVYSVLSDQMRDFDLFIGEVLDFLRNR